MTRKFNESRHTPNKPPKQNNVPIVKKTQVRKTRTKTLTTSNNHITISRRHRRCNSCREYPFPVEVLFGPDNNYTCGARRLIAFAAAKGSFDKNLVGRRLKQTGACWWLRQAEKMTVLCAAFYSDKFLCTYTYLSDWVSGKKMPLSYSVSSVSQQFHH
ncbi:MAG: hypothetical protein LBN39_11795 [Planctomycetaceae bacterium]|nr:hypothetical protein [Planctomycetaceae bacterium]